MRKKMNRGQLRIVTLPTIKEGLISPVNFDTSGVYFGRECWTGLILKEVAPLGCLPLYQPWIERKSQEEAMVDLALEQISKRIGPNFPILLSSPSPQLKLPGVKDLKVYNANRARSPTLLTSAWFGCHSKTIALTSAHFFKRSLMADVGIGPLSSSTCSERDTFQCVSRCSSSNISWSSFVVSSSSCPIMSSSMSSSFNSNSRSLAVVKISSIISGGVPDNLRVCVHCPNTKKIFRESIR
ncbi:uncharacterized protein TNCV_487801 [Trichonephila clavipes]|nr:uncharacterized protein TNCV_487801 [Trichonephila clavipes]